MNEKLWISQNGLMDIWNVVYREPDVKVMPYQTVNKLPKYEQDTESWYTLYHQAVKHTGIVLV